MNINNSIIEDLEAIFKLYKQAKSYQTEKKMVVWPTFDKEMVVQEIEEKKQFKLLINNQIGCVWAIAFSDPLIWKEKNKDSAIYIHRIATNAEFRGNNFVEKIVIWAKEYAKVHQKKFIRMDTVGENFGLIKHYQKMGFQFLGLSELRETNGLPGHYKNATVSLFEIAV
jgi:ribosomal protein S18 acetylase RimI-like enzyme